MLAPNCRTLPHARPIELPVCISNGTAKQQLVSDTGPGKTNNDIGDFGGWRVCVEVSRLGWVPSATSRR